MSYISIMNKEDPRNLSLNIGDADIEYLLYDNGGTDMIFLHATGFLPWLWHPIARKFSGSYRIIAPYFCNHRMVDPENGGISWVKLADDFKMMCEKLEVERPFLVGHSMGATILTIAAATLGINPEGMILFEPIFLPQEICGIDISVEQHPLASKSINRRNFWEDRLEALNYLRSNALFKTWDDEMIDLYVEYGMRNCENSGLKLACSPENEAALFLGSRHYNPWKVMHSVSCPVLVVSGGKSNMKETIEFEKAASMFPNGSYLYIKDAGHLIPMERPEATVKIIADFLGRT